MSGTAKAVLVAIGFQELQAVRRAFMRAKAEHAAALLAFAVVCDDPDDLNRLMSEAYLVLNEAQRELLKASLHG